MAVDAWYLVKSGGTATGDGGRVTTKPTGAWSATTSEYYGSIAEAIAATTTPTKDSLILVSNLHNFSTASTITYTGVLGPYYPLAVSVNNSNVEEYLAGASEGTTGTTADISINTSNHGLRMHGITLNVADELLLSGQNASLTVSDGAINFSKDGDRVQLISDACLLVLNNTDITFPSGGTAQQVFVVNNASTVEMIGGSISCPTNNIDTLFGDGGGNGGLFASVKGVDLTSISDFLLENVGSDTTDDIVDIAIDGCKLSDTVVDKEEDFHREYQRMSITNSSSSAAAAEYGDRLYTWTGTILDTDSTGIVRIDSVTFDSGAQSALQITTTADCSISHPLTFDMPSRFTKLASTETTLILYFAVVNTVTLTDTNIWAEVLNPNGTTGNQWDYKSSRNTDILATGTTWTDDSASSVWENNGVDLTGYNEYRMEIPITGGGDGYPLIRLNIAEPSLAGTLYVSREIGVS